MAFGINHANNVTSTMKMAIAMAAIIPTIVILSILGSSAWPEWQKSYVVALQARC